MTCDITLRRYYIIELRVRRRKRNARRRDRFRHVVAYSVLGRCLKGDHCEDARTAER